MQLPSLLAQIRFPSQTQLIRRPRGRRQSQQVARMMLHDRFLQELEAGKAQGFDLLTWGDSITESFRGTTQGMPDPVWFDNQAAFNARISSKYRAGVFSIAGEQAGEMLWRLRNGGGPRGVAVKVCMAMVGTNDVFYLTEEGLGDADRVAGIVFEGVAAVLEELAAQAPAASLVVLSLPPLQPQWSGGAEMTRHQPVVDLVNQQLQQWASERLREGQRVLYADCTSPFLLPGPGRRLDPALMPDGEHPEGLEGGGRLAECVAQALREALGEAGE